MGHGLNEKYKAEQHSSACTTISPTYDNVQFCKTATLPHIVQQFFHTFSRCWNYCTLMWNEAVWASVGVKNYYYYVPLGTCITYAKNRKCSDNRITNHPSTV